MQAEKTLEALKLIDYAISTKGNFIFHIQYSKIINFEKHRELESAVLH